MQRLLLALLCTPAVFGAQLMSDRSLVFTPSIKQMDARTTIWATNWGSYQKEFQHRRTLRVEMHAIGEVERTFAAIWCFIGRNADGTGLVYMGHGERTAQLRADNTFVFEAESLDFTGYDDKYAAEQKYERGGVRPMGWAMCIIQRGRIVASTGATPECAEMGRAFAAEQMERRKKDKAKSRP